MLHNQRPSALIHARRTGKLLTLLCALIVIFTAAAATMAAPLDFDGDGKTDHSVVRNDGTNLYWYILRSGNNTLQAQAWGIGGTSADLIAPGDYDGDGNCDIAVRRPSDATFYVLRSSDNLLQAVSLGFFAENPIASGQDFDGDGKAEFVLTGATSIFNPLSWRIKFSLSGLTQVIDFGVAGDYPIKGDFDGDGNADLAIYRRSASPQNTFMVLRSSDGMTQSETFGTSQDRIVSADFDGDGKTDYAVYRPNDAWYWLRSSDGEFRSYIFGGLDHDAPAPGDYDGDGTTDQAIFRTGPIANDPAYFYVNGSTAGFSSLQWGTTGDFSVADRAFAF